MSHVIWHLVLLLAVSKSVANYSIVASIIVNKIVMQDHAVHAMKHLRCLVTVERSIKHFFVETNLSLAIRSAEPSSIVAYIHVKDFVTKVLASPARKTLAEFYSVQVVTKESKISLVDKENIALRKYQHAIISVSAFCHVENINVSSNVIQVTACFVRKMLSRNVFAEKQVERFLVTSSTILSTFAKSL